MGNFEVGQEVILRGRGEDKTLTITRIGRKYAYVQPYGPMFEAAYHLDNGFEKSDRFIALTRILTPAMAAEEDQKKAAIQRLPRAVRHDLKYLAADQIERIADIIEEGQ